MSRLRRLRKRENIIKTTTCGLALALAIGSVQGLGTYALFTDIENLPSNIAISTGDVDVEVCKGLDLTEVKPADNREIPVTITNKGTLNQNIRLELSISKYIKSYLEYEFVFNDGITINNGFMYDGEELFVLTPGSSINGFINITVKEMNKEEQNNLSAKEQNIDLTVTSTQINKDNTLSNNRFYDVAIQKSTINIAQREMITIDTGANAHYINDKGNRYTSLYIPVNVNGITEENKDEINITATIKDSKVSYKAEYVDKGKYKYIKITPKTDDYIEFQDFLNITINIKIGEDEEYSQLCWLKQDNASNSNCEEHNHPDGEKKFRCQIQVINPGHKTWSTLEEQSIPEVVEPIKEEVKISNKSEVVEVAKEEIEKPSELEVIKPSKKTEAIQE